MELNQIPESTRTPSTSENIDCGTYLLRLAKRIFPICRSLTGNGTRETLRILSDEMGGLRLREVPSGKEVFDWKIPREWNIRDAYLLDPEGKKIIDFHTNNLHVVGYSVPVDRELELNELQKHLHSLPNQPSAIPYITSYYEERWGFCLTDAQRLSLKPGRYRAVIDSSLTDGNLTYADALIPGETDREIFLSSYVCHPSMANNELSGPVILTAIARWLKTLPRRKYTYRLALVPETIGAITYLHENLDHLKAKVDAGLVLTCIGDDRNYSFLPSRKGNTLADRAARHVLAHTDPAYRSYSYFQRGSDERQYCSPGVDLPMASIMRTKYGEYPEYHTSLDDFSVVTARGLEGGFRAVTRFIECLEMNETYRVTVLCEPQLGRRGLYPTMSTKDSQSQVEDVLNLVGHCDGTEDVLSLAEHMKRPLWKLRPLIDSLVQKDLLRRV